MTREFLRGLEISEEAVNKIMDEHGKAITKYQQDADKIKTQDAEIGELKQQIKDRDKQLDGLKGVNADELQAEIERLKSENKKTTQECDQRIAEIKRGYALDDALKSAGARNPKAVRALLDNEKITFDGEKISGLDEQLKELQKTDDFLFAPKETEGKTAPAVTGVKPTGAAQPTDGTGGKGVLFAQKYNAARGVEAAQTNSKEG